MDENKTQNLTNRDYLDMFFPDALICTGHDNAIIGTVGDKVLYDQDIIIQNLENDGMTHEEAVEYFYFNIEGSYMGEKTPIYASLIRRSNNDSNRKKMENHKRQSTRIALMDRKELGGVAVPQREKGSPERC